MLGQRFIDLINYVELHSSLCLKKLKAGLQFKKKRLEKNDNNQNQSAGCTHYLTNKQILILSNYSQVFLSE